MTGVSPEFHRAHNRYVLELTGINSLLSEYQYHILPQLLQVNLRSIARSLVRTNGDNENGK